jgi:hypothetical protein
MKCLRRNMTEFEYLPYDGTMTDLNDDGEHTGEFHPAYGDPIPMRGNISMPSGHVNQMFYGQDIRYTHTLVIDNPDTEITESGKIRWKKELYDIQAVRPSINFVSIAMRQQTKDNYEPYVPEDGDGE